MIRIEDDGSIEYTLQMLDRAACSVEERRTLFPLVDLILDQIERARKDGIFALEKTVNELRPRVLREGVSMALDGNCPEYIARELYYRIFCGGACGVELLRNIVSFEGVRGIQQGWHPVRLRDALLPFFGAGMIEEAERYFDMSRAGLRARLAERLAGTEALPAREPGVLLEEPIGEMRDVFVRNLTWSRQFSEIYQSDVAVALSYASGAVRKKMFAMMPLKQALYIVDDSGYSVDKPIDAERRKYWDKRVAQAQSRIIEAIEALKKSGEIR